MTFWQLLMQLNWPPRGSCPQFDCKASLLCYSGNWGRGRVGENSFIRFTEAKITGHKHHVCWVLESVIPEIVLWLNIWPFFKDWRRGERIWCLDMKSKYFAWKLQRKITKRISNIRWIFDWRPPPSSFQRERTSDSLSELLQIARQKALEMFCCEQRGMRRKRRERRSQADGRNKWRQSVEEVRGSDKLSTARQPKSLSQSITFFPPLLSVCLIDFFFIPPESLTQMTAQGFFGVRSV